MRTRIVILVASLTSLAVGCAHSPPTRHETVYRGLSEALPRLDPSILAGRRIVIDPGHGGHFRGTLGQEGLTEASVNLGVSLYLWGLLKESGAEVYLTRSAERDFLSEADSALASDLRVRVDMVDSLQPDIFVSVHHNAQPQRDPSHNRVETYYRFGDPASRDLAFSVHRHLMRNLGIQTGEVRPGNYFVLRNTDAPAILGEGSYLTSPPVENNLRLSEKQRLEAEAYYLGILEYFSRGTPHIELIAPLESVLTDIPTVEFAVHDVGGLGIDPGRIQLQLGERHVTPHLSATGDLISYSLSWDAPNGAYTLRLAVRNILGNSSNVRTVKFRIDLPPESATFNMLPRVLPPSGGTVRVRARLLDRRGLAVADSTAVSVRTSAGAAPAQLVVRAGALEFPLTVASGAPPVEITLAAGGREFSAIMGTTAGPVARLRMMTVVDAATREPIHNATVIDGDSLIANGSHSGTYFLPAGAEAPARFRVLAPGYIPDAGAGSAADTLLLTPWYAGKLLGVRFMIDPEGGFGPKPGMGGLGLSGPFANLQVARYLEEYLSAAGAIVELTRHSEVTLSPRDVVALTNRMGADRYLEIRHRALPADSGLVVGASYFPGSRNGARLATSIQHALADYLGLATRAPYSEVTFPLQQTACPAIVVEMPSLTSTEEELRLGEPWYQRRQAYGVFLGILEHYGAGEGLSLRVAAESDTPQSNWLVTVDDTWRLLTDPDGVARFMALPAGNHSVEARRGGLRIDLGSVTLPAESAEIPTLPFSTNPHP